MTIGSADLRTLRVHAIRTIAPRIRWIALEAADGQILPPHPAGAHLDFDLPDGMVRSYSLCNDPEQRDRYCIAVLREENSRGGSAWMHEHVAEGDLLEASDPINNFALDPAADSHVLIAGGIGITPIMAMCRHLNAIGAPFVLHYCTRAASETAFLEPLQAQLGERLHLYHDGGDPARGLDIAALLRVKPPGGHVYVCGPISMIRAVRTATSAWPKGTVHWESFGGTDADSAPASNDQPFEIELAKSGLVLMVPADRKILDVLRSAGVKVRTQCTEGVCGTCRVRYLSGEVDHRDEVLTAAQGKQFLQVCVSRAKPHSRLVLDL